MIGNQGKWTSPGKDSSEGESRVDIRSDDLQQTVTGRVNENWQPGTKVQFDLDPHKTEETIALGSMTHITFFKYQRDHSETTKSRTERKWKKTPEWRIDMFPKEVEENDEIEFATMRQL